MASEIKNCLGVTTTLTLWAETFSISSLRVRRLTRTTSSEATLSLAALVVDAAWRIVCRRPAPANLAAGENPATTCESQHHTAMVAPLEPRIMTVQRPVLLLSYSGVLAGGFVSIARL